MLCRSDLVEILGAKNRPEGGLGQELGAVMSILHVGHTHSGVADPVVHHSVHRDRHTVLGENLLGHNIEYLLIKRLVISTYQSQWVHLGPQVDGCQFINAGQDKVKTRSPGLAMLDPSQSEDDRPLVLLDYLETNTEGEG